MGSVPSSSWNNQFQQIKEAHDNAYHTIETAITLEEQEKPHEAIEKYKEGILEIDKALNIQIECPESPDFSWEQARLMIQKMKKTRAEVLMRINCITSSPSFVPQEPPPSYEEATSSSSSSSVGDVPRTYSELATALNDLPIETNNEPAQVIYSHDGVRLYFISPDGTVTQTSQPETLNIAVIPANARRASTVFLQIGDWVYPLVPGVSPCYRTDYGAFILPDLHSDVPGSSIGIILPSDADASVYELLENILHGIISQGGEIEGRAERRRREIEGPTTISGTISNGLITGAYYISQGLIKGAQKAGWFMSYGTPKIINRLAPATQNAEVSTTLTRGLEIASSATGSAASFTGYVAGKVGSATHALGQFLAPHIQKQGTRLLTSGFNLTEEEASSKVNGILTVAAGAVEGFSTIYTGLETSASILGNNLSNNTVMIVQHRYGAPAGQVASHALNTVGNVITIGHNTRFLTPKGLAKTAARETGKAVVQDVRHTLTTQRQNSINAPSTSTSVMYPNLKPMQHAQTKLPTYEKLKEKDKKPDDDDNQKHEKK